METQTSIQNSYKRRRTIALWTFLLSQIPFAAIDLLLLPPDSSWHPGSFALNSVICVACIYQWCLNDARVRQFHLTGGWTMAIVFVAIFAVPVYLQRTRGWKGALRVGWGLPILAANVMLYEASRYLGIVLTYHIVTS